MNGARPTRLHVYLWWVILAFAMGAAAGVLLQRAYGVGNILRAVGVLPPQPEATLPPTPTRPPVGILAEFHGRLSLFVLAGQSNMSGRAELPPEQVPHPRAYVFGNDYQWRLAVEPVDDPTGQVDRASIDMDEEAPGFSPGLAFARALLKQEPELIIGLIPCAKGDTTIHEWRQNLSDQSLYGSCQKRIGAASTMGEVAGILFFQGEADALDPVRFLDRVLSADTYQAEFTRLIHAWRADLSQPHLPVVFAQIGSHTAPEHLTHWTRVQEQQAAVSLPCVAMITTDDLPLRDAVHYTTESYQVIGERFAEAYGRLMQTQDCQ